MIAWLHTARARVMATRARCMGSVLLGATCITSMTVVGQPHAAKPAAPAPERTYTIAVASEATDEISIITFGPGGAAVQTKVPIGLSATDPDGPHGVTVSPDQQFYYVSTAHGTPFGNFWKIRASDNVIVGRVMLGNFPATAQITPEGHLAFVVNFNLHGDMVRSDVSVVGVDDMVEVTRVPTCIMPHGSRINRQGTKHYSACMMDDMLVEIDIATFTVSRHFLLTKGKEMGMDGPPMTSSGGAAHDMSGHGMTAPAAGDPTCSPTWAQPSADGSRIYVACNKTSDIVEIDAGTWQMLRRVPTGNGVYNLATTHDGTKLIATNKRGQSVSIIELPSGRELARIPTKRKVVHGAAVSADDRYVFISVEGIGSEPGTVEIIDLRTLTTVATVDVGQMAGGIDVLR
ncbi:MAG: YncE family protein [Gemmatimonadaceae bacterium]|nr:YncE family protein [Gemmatimonadaceae bacterium]